MGGVPQSLFLLSLSLTLLTFSTPSYLPVINPPPSSHNLSRDLLSERVQPECATSSSAASAPAKQSARGVAHIFNKQRSGDTICNQHKLAVSSATSPSPLTTTSPGRSSPTLTPLTFSTTRSTSHLPVINPPPSSHLLSCDLLSERVQPECATSSSAASAPAKQSARGVAHIFNKQRSGDTICNQHKLAVSSATSPSPLTTTSPGRSSPTLTPLTFSVSPSQPYTTPPRCAGSPRTSLRLSSAAMRRALAITSPNRRRSIRRRGGSRANAYGRAA